MPFTMPEPIVNDTSEVDAVPLMTNFNYLLAFLDPSQTGLSSANFDSTKQLILNPAMHGQIEGGTDLHDASAISLLDTDGNWDAANLEALAIEIADIVKPTGLPATGGIPTFFDKQFNDNAYTANKTVAELGPTQIVVPANTTTKGIKIELVAVCSLAGAFASEGILDITVKKDGTPGILATRQYKLTWGSQTDDENAFEKYDHGKFMYYLAADGWDGAVENIIQVGPFTRSGTNVTLEDFTLAVSVIT